MSEYDGEREGRRDATPRLGFLKGVVAGGAGLTMASLAPSAGLAATGGPACTEDKRDIVDALLLAERVAMTFYYTGLTTAAIANPGPAARAATKSGALAHLAYVQLALAEEQRHGQLWRGMGATTPYDAFYFPAAAFTRPGYTNQSALFLGVLDYLETVLVGAYLAAIARLALLGHTDQAVLAVQILQTECTHRVLGRAIAGDAPADNVTLEVDAFRCMADATTALQPFITGRGFRGGATAAIPQPSAAQVARAVRG